MINLAPQQKALKGKPHRWQKGESGNPKGAVPKPEKEILRQALLKHEKKNGKHLIDHAIELAYKDHNVLIAILKKILPDKTENEQIFKSYLMERLKDKSDVDIKREAEQLATKILGSRGGIGLSQADKPA